MIELKKLPYEINALEPYIDSRTVELHYTKHHQGYVDKLNLFIKGTEFENLSLEEIVLKSNGAIFNNAAQVRNHTFYRDGLKPYDIGGGNQKVSEDLLILKKIIEKWGSLDGFKEAFVNSAVGNFGSGRTWLVINQSRELEILNTSNADCPMTKGLKALLTVDVREHAYYLNYQNRRIEYVNNRWNLINRDRVNSLLEIGN